MDGAGSRFSACRASFRSVSLMVTNVLSRSPWVERGANGAHRQNIRRKQAPLAAGAMFGAQRVDDLVHIDPGKAQRRDAARAVIARQGAACRAPTPLRLSVASPQSCTKQPSVLALWHNEQERWRRCIVFHASSKRRYFRCLSYSHSGIKTMGTTGVSRYQTGPYTPMVSAMR